MRTFISTTALLLTLPNLAYPLSLLQSINNLGLPGLPCTYDYIIVGGGTSGLTIAARLAENSAISVAVVEAGGFYEVESGAGSVIPGLAAAQNTGTDVDDDSPLIDWNFDTTAQPGAAGRVIRYARGKTLGGSSGRNLMVYHRGTVGSYQKWADAVGDSSYTWSSLLPYFKKSCTLTAPNYSAGKRNTNGTVDYTTSGFDNSLNGPLQVSWPNWASPLSSWIVEGFSGVGISPLNDPNSGSLNGSSWVSTTINPSDQTRDSSETSFLDYAVSNSKLKVYQHTMAKKILFNSAKKATGVKVETFGVGYTLTARKEVIVSAGTFQSPQLLMVSGIGPQATLQSYGISVIKDLKGVGQNMWDHVMFGSTFPVNVITATRLITDTLFSVQALADYLLQKGPLTAPGFGALAWEKLPKESRATLSNATLAALEEFPADWPEVEYLGLDGILGYWHNADDQDVADGHNYGSVGAALVAPLSRGNVTIRSADMDDAPVINPNFLSHPADAEVAVAALKRARAVWAALPDVLTGDEYLPGPNVQTDAQLLQYIRESMTEVWHASGTCSMGKSTDPSAVVDKYAKVFGVTGLRVVDASVFPILPPGHPQSNCYMIAEKIAQDIKNGN